MAKDRYPLIARLGLTVRDNPPHVKRDELMDALKARGLLTDWSRLPFRADTQPMEGPYPWDVERDLQLLFGE